MTTGIGGLSSILGLMNNLPSVLSVIDKLFYFGICMSLGGLVMRGWKRYKNWSINIIGSVSFGILCIIGGVLLSQVIPVQLPFLEGILQALITAVILYTTLSLITGGVNIIGKIVTREQFNELKNAFDSLKTEFIHLRSILERKNVMPEKLGKKDLEKKLTELLDLKAIKQYETLSVNEKEDMTTFIIKDNKLNQYKTVFDSYTGDNISFIQINLKIGQKITNAFRVIGNNPRILTGVIVLTLFSLLLTTLVNNESLAKITDRLSVTQATGLTTGSSATNQQSILANYEINNTSCLTSTDLLYVIGTQSYTSMESNVNVTGRLSVNLINKYPSEALLNGIQVNYEGNNYMLALTSTITQNEFNTALQNYMQNNMLQVLQGNTDFCAITHKGLTIDNYLHVCSARLSDDTVCDCRLLKDIKNYCFVFSDMISSQVSSQLGQQTGNTSGTQGSGLDLQSILGLLGQLK